MAAVAGPSGHVVGVDPAVPAIAYARRRARPGLTFAGSRGSLERGGQPAGTGDGSFSIHSKAQ